MPKLPICDCGHTKAIHYQGGCCKDCGCTWYHPNKQYIKKKKLSYESKSSTTNHIHGSNRLQNTKELRRI